MEGLAMAQAKHNNFIFGTLHERLTLHYGTKPLLGFHLAIAHVALSDRSPLRPNLTAPKNLDNSVKAALIQFRAYAEAFRAVSSRMIVRFINADALTFCHVLQHH